jgi:hypothetical protein
MEFLVELTWILFFFDVIMTSLRRCWNDRRSFHIKNGVKRAAQRLVYLLSLLSQQYHKGMNMDDMFNV